MKERKLNTGIPELSSNNFTFRKLSILKYIIIKSDFTLVLHSFISLSMTQGIITLKKKWTQHYQITGYNNMLYSVDFCNQHYEL